MSIAEKIDAYHTFASGEHHRYRSWDHCYRFFRRIASAGRRETPDESEAALQLGFYLASWGMYRGSSFLLQHDYTVHIPVVDRLFAPELRVLWENEFGAQERDSSLLPSVLTAVRAVREAYAPFGQATDTLVTKVLLGTVGCLPASDRFFLFGFKSEGFSYSYLNTPFIERLLTFCESNLAEFRETQMRLGLNGGIQYPLMKLVDMYFWQIGYEAGVSDTASDPVA